MKLAYVGAVDAVSPWLLRAIAGPNVQFIAVCESSPDRAERAAATFHARWPFNDLDLMLRESAPDAVITAAPMARRESVIRACLAAGCPVMVVGMPLRPHGRATRKADAFVWSASAARFSPAGGLIRRLVESGEIGEPLAASGSLVRCRTARAAEESAWPVSRDAVFELIDFLESLMGPAREIFARGHPDGALTATVVTDGDVPMSVQVFEHGRPEAAGMSVNLRGVDGTLLTLGSDMRVWCACGARAPTTYTPSLTASDPTVELGYTGLVQEFARRASERRGAESMEAGWAAPARTVEAIMTAITRAGPVKLDPRPR